MFMTNVAAYNSQVALLKLNIPVPYARPQYRIIWILQRKHFLASYTYTVHLRYIARVNLQGCSSTTYDVYHVCTP